MIDSRAEYVDAGGESSQVASCDIYDFIDGSLAAITTYAVEMDSAADRGHPVDLQTHGRRR